MAGFHYGDAVPHRLCTFSRLAHALARDAELVGKLAEDDRFFGEPTREDASLPVVERGERRGECLAAVFQLLARGECRLLVVGMFVESDLPAHPKFQLGGCPCGRRTKQELEPRSDCAVHPNVSAACRQVPPVRAVA